MKTREETIIWQNQSHLIQRHFSNCGICPDLYDICLATDIMVEFAQKGHSKELMERFTNYEKYIMEKYSK